jgi:(p)ppGpp synthase/HD superfamily hydrolase
MPLHDPKLFAPDFAQGSELLGEAFRFAREAYRAKGRRGEIKLSHSLEVAKLLHDAGFDEKVVGAGLLHDVIEATAIELPEVAERFGSRVGSLVEAMTEDEEIGLYEARKAEHRARVAARGSHSAAIYAADKLAKMPHLRADADAASERQLVHYQQTVETLRASHPDLPFLHDLEQELAALRLQRNRFSGQGEPASA